MYREPSNAMVTMSGLLMYILWGIMFTVVSFLFRISSSLLTLFSKIHAILKIIPTWPIKLQVDILISKNQALQILYLIHHVYKAS